MMVHPVDIYVGQRLQLRRNMLGLSQDSLAKSVGITFQQVQKYEKGFNRIASSRLYEFSKILKTDFDWFVKGFNEAEQEQLILTEDQYNTAENHKTIKLYNRTPDQIKKSIRSLLKAVSAPNGG